MAGIEWSDYVPNERDEILMRARRGDLDPAQAEGWARENGQRPFASMPDENAFDPMAEPYWSLGMTAAWILWRTASSVRNYWNDYRTECWEWRAQEAVYSDGRRERGWKIDQREPVSLFDTLNEATRKHPDPSMVASPTACRGELWLRLRAGELTATGIAHGRKDRVVIPEHDWIDLDYFEPDCGGPNAIGVHREDQPRYYDVRVTTAEVMALWEPRPTALLSPSDEDLQRLAARSALAWIEPFWTAWHVLSWIAFRDKDRLCRIENSSDFRQANWYSQPPIAEQKPHDVLRAALRRDEVTALGTDGAAIPSAKWAFVDKVWKQECIFRRNDILRIWTERGLEPNPSPAERLSDDDARQLIQDVASNKGGFVTLAEGVRILEGT